MHDTERQWLNYSIARDACNVSATAPVSQPGRNSGLSPVWTCSPARKRANRHPLGGGRLATPLCVASSSPSMQILLFLRDEGHFQTGD